MISSSDHVVFIPKGGSIRTSLISKESSAANPSFRVYYGVAAGAVPFLWESEPGTPKHGLSAGHAAAIPPLTPPPAYFSSPARGRPSPLKCPAAGGKKSSPLSPGRLIHAILPRLRKPPAAGMSRSSSASGSSSCSSPAPYGQRPSCPPPYLYSEEDEEEEEDASPTSTLCFGGWHGRGGRGCNAWVAAGGHGSSS